MNGKITVSGSLLSGVDVLSCRKTPVPKIIQGQLEGGAWYVQTIGTPALKADVDLFVVGMAMRDQLFSCYSNGAYLTVDFDGYDRTGFIMAEPSCDLLKPSDDVTQRKYKMSLQLAIVTEVA